MHFRFEQRVAADPRRVFAFFADPQNLAVLHRHDPTFRLLRHSGSVAPGSETWIETRVAGVLPVVLGFRHDECLPERCFSERLVHGPFSCFAHRHEFEAESGGTLVRDVLEIRLPWLFGGEPAVRRLVAPGVRRRFALRHAALTQLFAAGAAVAVG